MLKIGVFLPFLNNGWIVSTRSPQYKPTFPFLRDITLEAERQGFDFALAGAKFGGYGGPLDFWDYTLESITTMTALAATVPRIEIHGSICVLTVPPAVVARMVATMDSVSNSRCGVNIIAANSEYDYAHMGLWPGEWFYEQRYEYTTEYVQVLRKLWEEGRASFDGKYFKIKDFPSLPKPAKHVQMFVASHSARGMQLAAEYADRCFVTGDIETLKKLRTMQDVQSAKTGRYIGHYALYGIIARDTDEEAINEAKLYMSGAENEALNRMVYEGSADKKWTEYKKLNPKAVETAGADFKFLERPPIELPDGKFPAVVNGGCFTSSFLCGSYDRVAAYLDAAATEAKLAGIVTVYPSFLEGIKSFGENVIPRMKTRATVKLG